MTDDKDLEDFLRRYIEPAVKPTKASEILLSGLPKYLGPKLDLSRPGRKRWVTRVSAKPDNKRFTIQFPML